MAEEAGILCYKNPFIKESFGLGYMLKISQKMIDSIERTTYALF